MVYHIVMWNFKKEVEEARKTELLATMQKNLEALVGVVPGLLSVKYVANPLPTSTHEFALVTTLEKVEDVKSYGAHPAHVAVAENDIKPYACDRVCLDYEV
jgi:hypothetical protein